MKNKYIFDIVFVLIVLGSVAAANAGTFDNINKVQIGTTLVNVGSPPAMFSVNRGATGTSLTGCTNLKLEGGGAWFTYRGTKYYVHGEFLIQFEPDLRSAIPE